MKTSFAFVGYCFSAALPPLLATATHCAINKMDANPEMFETLHENCEIVQDAFSNMYGLDLCGDRISPIKHLRMSAPLCKSYCNDDRKRVKKIMQQIVDEVRLYSNCVTIEC